MVIGVQVVCVIGYSIGEYVVVVYFGVMLLVDVVCFICVWGCLMVSECEKGLMVVVFVSVEEICNVIEILDSVIDIVVVNGLCNCVIFGEKLAVE